MARSEARIYCRVWGDPDFRSLSADAQRVYFLALSQPGLTFCGVIDYTPRRWARLASDTTPETIEKAVRELEEKRYVVVDESTEELWVRSFTKNDGVLNSPNLVKAMWKDYAQVLSEPIRKGFEEGLPEPFKSEVPRDSTDPSPYPNPLLLPPPPPGAANGSVIDEVLERIAERNVQVAKDAGQAIRNARGFLGYKRKEAAEKYGERARQLVCEDPTIDARTLFGVLTNAGLANTYRMKRERETESA